GADGSLRELFACTMATGATLEQEVEARKQAAEYLAVIGLADHDADLVGYLPHGQRKLVELARAIAAGPRVLLLDETAAGMNDAEKSKLKDLIRQFCAQGTAVVLIEHDIDFIMDLSEGIVVMNFGRKIADGRPDDVSRDEAVLAAYLGT